MFLKYVSLFLLLSATCCPTRAQSSCEFSSSRGRFGFCTRDVNCCQGTKVNNLCDSNAICCFGRYECNQNQPNQPDCPPIVSRATWKARASSSALKSLPMPLNRVIVHHTDDGDTCNTQSTCSVRVRSLQSYHQLTKKWLDIAWNFLIGGDGAIYEGIGWNREGFHTLDWNNKSLGVAFIGNFAQNEVNDQMIDSLRRLLDCGTDSNYLTRDFVLSGHRDANPKTRCPGDQLYGQIEEFEEFSSDLN